MIFYLYDQIDKKFINLVSSLSFGRTEGDVTFPEDDLMSRRHCQFVIEGTNVYVDDLGSLNKTRVNTVPIVTGKRRKLGINDVIEFGKRRFVLTNQNRFVPGNVAERTRTTRAWRVASRRTDGSLTSQITGVIANRTRVVLSRAAYRSLRIREFAHLRGWDASTLVVVVSVGFAWLMGLVYLNSVGAFAPGLRHSSFGLTGKFLLVAILSTILLGLSHYLIIRKKYPNAFVRMLFVPLWWASLLLILPGVEAVSALGSEVSENVTEYVCVRRFNPEQCHFVSQYRIFGFEKLPREVKQSIKEKMGRH